jgi:hypothetical protein
MMKNLHPLCKILRRKTSFGDVQKLARTMSWKLAADGLPVGGAKAGLRCAPDHPQIAEILIDAAEAWRRPLSESVVLGKDMGASDELGFSLSCSWQSNVVMWWIPMGQPLQLFARVLGAVIRVTQQRIRLVDRVHPSHTRGHRPPKSLNCFKF